MQAVELRIPIEQSEVNLGGLDLFYQAGGRVATTATEGALRANQCAREATGARAFAGQVRRHQPLPEERQGIVAARARVGEHRI
jgi:hypothetical protein